MHEVTKERKRLFYQTYASIHELDAIVTDASLWGFSKITFNKKFSKNHSIRIVENFWRTESLRKISLKSQFRIYFFTIFYYFTKKLIICITTNYLAKKFPFPVNFWCTNLTDMLERVRCSRWRQEICLL